MSTAPPPPDVHAEVFDLLPWWVNGTLDDVESATVEEHLQLCAACRQEATAQRRIREAMRQNVSNVEHAPQASFERLWSRIEELERDVPRADAAPVPPAAARPNRWNPASTTWRLAAGVVLVVGAASLGTLYWRASPQQSVAVFHTATTGSDDTGIAAAPRIRAVFAHATTVEELAQITRAAGVSVVAGPTDAGVYTLAVDRGPRPLAVDEALDRLREDPRVRFAEPVAAQ